MGILREGIVRWEFSGREFSGSQVKQIKTLKNGRFFIPFLGSFLQFISA